MIDALRSALSGQHRCWADLPIEPLPDKGLAHLHLRIQGSGVLARIPKQSQMCLPAAEHLAYEAACFDRAALSGYTPQLHGVLPPSATLPRGALLVQEIVGRPLRLPQDLPALVRTLAALHALPLPPVRDRAPLLDPGDPLAALLAEIDYQARHLDAALLSPQVRDAIEAELLALRALVETAARPPKQLISFDAHPGNFIVDAQGRAMLVDLEKARYGAAPLDLAHATLYTSTTWDVASSATLTLGQVAQAYADWSGLIHNAPAQRPWLVPLRRAMWLWSITWCAKWRALAMQGSRGGNGGRDRGAGGGEDWSTELSDPALVAHVRERVDHYLSPSAVMWVRDEASALQREFAAAG